MGFFTTFGNIVVPIMVKIATFVKGGKVSDDLRKNIQLSNIEAVKKFVETNHLLGYKFSDYTKAWLHYGKDVADSLSEYTYYDVEDTFLYKLKDDWE